MFSRSTTASIRCIASGLESSLFTVTFDAPRPVPRRFRRLLPGQVSGFSAFLSASPLVIEIRVSFPFLRVRAFPPVDGGTMPSADFYQFIPPPLDDSSTMANWQTSPGNAHPPSRLCPPHLRPCFPYRYWTLKLSAFSSSTSASYAIPVRGASTLPAASFRFHLAVDTLAVRLTIPPVGFVENFHLQVGAPCRAHRCRPAAATQSPRLLPLSVS